MDLALFEVRPGLPRRRAGRAAPASHRPAGRRRRGARSAWLAPPVDVFDAKADAEAVLAALGAPAKVPRSAARWRAGGIPAGRAMIGLGPVTLATFGEIHPRVLPRWM
jgi:phenylalanyl-tRNA synthetase beta chain